jgi:hypothetical protein
MVSLPKAVLQENWRGEFLPLAVRMQQSWNEVTTLDVILIPIYLCIAEQALK